MRLETRGPCCRVTLPSALNDVDASPFENDSLLVGRWRASSVEFVSNARIPGNCTDSLRHADVLTNTELGTGAVRLLRFEHHISFGIKQRPREPLELVIPIASLAIKRMFDVEVPTFGKLRRSIGTCR